MRKSATGLFCFSPPVMLATFAIEIILVVYTFYRYKLDTIGRLSVALLVFLAIFQLAEYNVCTAGWIDSSLASRIGYVAITALPPLGLHLAYALADAPHRPLVWPAYAAGGAFALFFLVIGHALTGNVCQGNYVIFEMAPGSIWLYTLYYYGLLLGTMALCWHLAKSRDLTTRRALYGLAAGYFAFIAPTTAANLLIPETIAGIPSIMCGFAVLFAFSLVFWVLPRKGGMR